jgi:hypothetical protein
MRPMENRMSINMFAESSEFLGENLVTLAARNTTYMVISDLWVTFFAVILTFFSVPLATYGADPQIQDVLIQKNPQHVTVYAKVSNCFTKEMDSAILTGMPVTFTFYVNFYQRRPFWFDKKLSSLTVDHTIKFDHVKKTFFVSSSHNKEPLSYQDFSAAKETMADLSGLEIVPIADLQKNASYYLEIKAKLKRVRLPLHMEYVFFFVSLWDFETSWFREEFRY